MFAQYLHVRPWEVDLLTASEFIGLCGYLDRIREDAKSAN